MWPQVRAPLAVLSVVANSTGFRFDVTDRESIVTVRGSPPTELETDSRVIVLDKQGILRSSYKRAADNTLAEAKKVVRSMGILGHGTRRPVLVDFRGMKSMDRDARAYFAGPATAAVVSATAILVDSSLEKALGNAFMGMNKPLVPTRLFTSEAQAMAWLKTHLPRSEL